MDEYLIDKARVRAAFDCAANSYDAAAVLQKLVREEMFDRLDLIKIAPQKILDLGCGTGHGSFSLQKRFKSASVFSLDLAFAMLEKTYAQQPKLKKMFSGKKLICADIENLPVAEDQMDLVWSNLALQWCNDLDKSFANIRTALKPNGLFIFSTFGPDTLKELRAATSNRQTHVSRFIDMHDIGDALTRNGFKAPVLDVERYTLGRARGLAGRGFLKSLTEQYEQFRMADGKLPATFEVVYGHAWTAEAKDGLGEGVSPVEFRPRV